MRAHPWRILQLAALTLFLPLVVGASEPVVVLEAEGQLWADVFVDYSPTPFTVDWWRHQTADGPSYHEQMQIPDTLYQVGYLVHCDADSISSHASWGDLDPEPTYFNSIVVATELSCLVQVQDSVRLVADRSSSGILGRKDLHEQEVLLTGPDLTTIEILGPGTVESHAERVLEPGQYRVSIYTQYWEYGEQDAFRAGVSVRWVDAVTPTRPATWGEVKALYR